MRSIALCMFLAIATPPHPTHAGADVEAVSRVDAVTVHRTSARVTRVARVEVEEGVARVALRGLPEALEDDSLRVEGKGSARARLLGVTVERVTGARAAVAEARAAEEQLEALQEEDHALEDRIRVAQARQKFVEGLRSTYSEERARNLAVRPVAAREWADLTAFVVRELTAATIELRRAEVGRRDLKRRIDAARAGLAKLAAKRGETTKRVAVEVEVARAGVLELAVTYAIANAGWGPVWDARLDPAASRVELALHASVWQRTGEDWNDVRLAVSTAAPDRALLVPQLSPRWIDRVASGVAKARVDTSDRSRPATTAAPMVARTAGEEATFEAEEAAAALQEALLSATLTVPRPASVDGAGQPRKVLLSRVALDAEVIRAAAPRVDHAAFLTAKAVNATGLPLLAGTASVWIDDTFVGRAPMPFTPPGGELRLAFGADDRIEVDRRVVERFHDTSGLLGKKDVWRYRVRTTVRNRRAEEVKLDLLDLVPVPRDGDIEVTLLDGTTAATREDPERPGVRIWALTLAPSEQKVVELRYEVRAPRGVALAGLE